MPPLSMIELGVTRLARLTGLDRVGVEVAAAVRPLGHVLQVTTGKGRRWPAAAASALGEAAELWAAERIAPEELRYGSVAGFRARGAEVWTGPLGSAGAALDLGLELDVDRAFAAFRPGRELHSGREVLLPAAALHCPPAGAPPIGPLAWAWSSNGMGSHPRPARALAHALLEAIERDQLARALPTGWTRASFSRNVRPESLPPALGAARRRLEAQGFQLELFDLGPSRSNGGLGLAMAGALLRDREGGALPGPVPLTAGYACRPAPAEALWAAFLEAAQSRLTDIQGLREDIAPMDPEPVAAMARELDRLRPGRHVRDMAGGRGAAGLPTLLRRMRAAGHRQVAAAELAPPGCGVSVIKVVVPTFKVSGLL